MMPFTSQEESESRTGFYDVMGQITKWTQQAGTATATNWSLTYDPMDRLLNVIVKDSTSQAIVRR
jgi:hypothetical protein